MAARAAGKAVICFLAMILVAGVAGVMLVRAQNQSVEPVAQAIEAPHILEYSLRLFDTRGNPLPDMLVHVELSRLPNGSRESSDRFAGDGIMSLRLVEGEYDATFLARAPDMDFSTYYAHQRIDTSLLLYNDTITFTPIARVRGVVMDSVENLIPDARLKFDCDPGTFGAQDRSDAFGSFSLDAVALGVCRIYASDGASTGVVDLVLNESKIYDVQIILQQKIIPKDDSIWWVRIAVALAIVILVLVVYYITRGPRWTGNAIAKEKAAERSERTQDKAARGRRSGKRQRKGEPSNRPLSATASAQAPSSSRLEDNDRLQAVLKTLDGYDKEIVQTLMSNNGTMTQNKIRYATSIPKTSLFRCIQRLEHRRIVKTESVGKMKKVTLEDFSK